MDYSSLCEATLISQLATGTTTGVTAQLKRVNGSYSTVTWPTGAHEIHLKRQTDDGTHIERVGVAAGTTQNNTTGVVTLGTLTRNLSLTNGSDFTGSAATTTWPTGTLLYVTWGIGDAEQTARKNEANEFSTHQTLLTTSELRLGSSAVAVWKDGSGNLSLKDAANGTKTLTQITAAAGTDEKIKVSSNDTNSRYLGQKLTGGDGITTTETTDGGDETLDIDVELATDPGLEFSSGGLRAKVKASGGLTRDSNGLSVSASDLPAFERWYGDSSDGAKTIASSENLNPASEFDYTTFTLNASQTLSVTSVNTPLIVRVAGDATINGTIDLNSKGGAGGAGVTAGTNGQGVKTADTCGAGGAGTTTVINGQQPGGGGGGASVIAGGSAGVAGVGAGAGGTAASSVVIAMLAAIRRNVICGAGGGGGGQGNTGNGGTAGTGGAGGGAMMMFIAGNLTLGASSIIRANGAAGTVGGNASGSTPGGGGGGGGGGGTVVIFVNGTITNNGVTVSATGGAGALGGSGNGIGCTGGTGATGRVIIFSISTGTFISS